MTSGPATERRTESLARPPAVVGIKCKSSAHLVAGSRARESRQNSVCARKNRELPAQAMTALNLLMQEGCTLRTILRSTRLEKGLRGAVAWYDDAWGRRLRCFGAMRRGHTSFGIRARRRMDVAGPSR